ncbi:MAG: Rrf2 family transcriptional regulator [bacterium]|nr:Rrf2 family transcriptional regulator [bacterium]
MFSQTSEYAIRALSILARYPRDQFILVGTLAASADLPHHYLSKILQNLVRMQILESRKGSKGGFRLARDPDQITLYQIVDAIENLNTVRRCLLGQAECSDDRACPLHEFWIRQTNDYLNTLQTTSLGDLVRFDGKLRSTAKPGAPTQ